MKDIIIGFVIILVVAIIADFIYSEQNVCSSTNIMGGTETNKCGFLKKQMNIEIELFDRYW